MNSFQAAFLILSAALLLVSQATAAKVPSEASCKATYDSLGGQSALLSRLSPCVGTSTPSAACCSAGQGLAGDGGPLAYCLCNPGFLNILLSSAEGAGVSRGSVTTA